MKHTLQNSLLKRLALPCAALLFAPSLALAGSRSLTAYGPRGGVYHQQVSRSCGSLGYSDSFTRPNGQTASRSFNTQSTGSGRTTNAQATGYNGKSASYSSTRVDNPDGYTRQVEKNGPNGGSLSKQIVVTDTNGTVTRNVVTTKTPPPQS